VKLLVVADPLDSFKLYKDSTYAMLRAADRRGHALHACGIADLLWRDGVVQARACPIRMTGSEPDWYAAGTPAWTALAAYDAVLMRKDPPFDAAYLNATYLLEIAERGGARVFNAPRALRDYNEKLAIARFPAFIVPTLVTCQASVIREFLAAQGDIVVKPLDAMGGSGVFRLRPGDPNLGAILETVTELGTRQVMAQRFIPEIAAGDKRILLIDGEPVPYCLARIPAPGETRGNLAAGGSGVARPLSARDREIAASLGPRLQQDGLLLVGLDVIGDWLTEVNVTSPTCFREITDQTGFDVAARFVDALERRAAEAR
jgi:glutathione synthase